MHINRSTALLIPALCAPLLLFGDVVRLHGGDQISGKVTQVKDSVLTIETAYAGAITITQTNIFELTIDTPVNVRVQTGTAPLEMQGALPPDGIATLWLPGADDPDTPPCPWNFSIAVDARYTSGNSDGTLAGLDAVANYLGEKWTLKLYAGGHYDKADGSVSEHKFFGGADADYALNDIAGLYIREKLEHDRINDIKIRSTFAAGYSHYLYKHHIPGDLEMFRLRLGLGHRYEKYRLADGSESAMTIDTGLKFRKRINDTLTWDTEITYAPAIDDLREYLITHESRCEVNLIKKWKLTHELGLRHEYNSRPADGKDQLDSTYFARLRKTW